MARRTVFRQTVEGINAGARASLLLYDLTRK